MSTLIRPELSAKNRYWINKHRYYELKHFCLQYPQWKKLYFMTDSITRPSLDELRLSKSPGNPTERCALEKMFYSDRMNLVEKITDEVDPIIGRYLLKGVTEGVSYDFLKLKLSIPCCKDTYYKLYRQFFWLLDKERG